MLLVRVGLFSSVSLDTAKRTKESRCESSRRATVETLLNHTCAIDGEYLPTLTRRRTDRGRHPPRIARQGQIHAPGAELSDGNSGGVRAGYLAQRLFGTSWY
jgi:hypothetical protein